MQNLIASGIQIWRQAPGYARPQDTRGPYVPTHPSMPRDVQQTASASAPRPAYVKDIYIYEALSDDGSFYRPSATPEQVREATPIPSTDSRCNKYATAIRKTIEGLKASERLDISMSLMADAFDNYGKFDEANFSRRIRRKLGLSSPRDMNTKGLHRACMEARRTAQEAVRG